MLKMTELHEWQMNSTGPEAYERYIVPAWMGEWAQALVETGGIGPGKRVLDVACGTGIVARKAIPLVGSSGKVAGLDANRGMLRVAKQFAELEDMHAIEWHQGNASCLPFNRAEYDVVLCQQGLQFFPDRTVALREMARVMVPGGRLAISVWRSLDRSPFLAVLADVIGRYLGADSTALFHASCSLADREELRTLLSNAGFRDIRIRLEVKMARYPSLAEFLPGYLSVFPFAAEVAVMKDADRTEMFRRMSTSLSDYMDDYGLAAPMESHVITASR
jgi:ubiquinone/menaquinone biosynthesis C-methylase UbiE